MYLLSENIPPVKSRVYYKIPGTVVRKLAF